MGAAGATQPPRRPHIVVLQHHERVPLGALTLGLERQADVTHLRGHLAPDDVRSEVGRLTRSGDYHGVVALGGPMGVYDQARFPFLTDSLRLLEDALQRGAPVLGLCLGSQLLGHALGERVFPGSERGLPPEVGYFPARLTEAGSVDPAMTLYEDGTPVLFWHRDTHDLPGGAVLLATSDRYPLAAYRRGSWTYGFQFHLEITVDWLTRWLKESPLAAESGVNEDEMTALGASVAERNAERATQLAHLFADDARTYSGG